MNPFLPDQQLPEERKARVYFDIYADLAERTAVIVLQDQEAVITEGEWSPWLTVEFQLLPHVKSVRGIVRFYLQEAGDRFRLYASPVNLAPGTSGLGTRGFDEQLLKALGPYYTKGMPEQTKALTQGLFTLGEYIAQSDMVLGERIKALDFLLEGFEKGFLFFYISTLDADCHVLWKHHDPTHQADYEKISSPYAGAIVERYMKMDEVLGRTRSRLRREDVLYVISDHGFGPFTSGLNLLAWLEKQGYLVYASCVKKRLSKFYADIDWSRTRAYPVGFNGLCLNLRGREAGGIVRPEEYDRLVEEIRDRLLAFRDTNGKAVFRNIYRPAEIYAGPQVKEAPDLILGHDRGYGPSDDSVLGAWPDGPVVSSVDGFSGHHCFDYKIVPGVLFSTRKLSVRQAGLADVTATVLKDFGIAPTEEMTGTPLY